jgi:hypothetical protein
VTIVCHDFNKFPLFISVVWNSARNIINVQHLSNTTVSRSVFRACDPTEHISAAAVPFVSLSDILTCMTASFSILICDFDFAAELVLKAILLCRLIF